MLGTLLVGPFACERTQGAPELRGPSPRKVVGRDGRIRLDVSDAPRLGSCSHLHLLLVLSITQSVEVNFETPCAVGFCRRIQMPVQQQTPPILMWYTAGMQA